MQIEPAAAAALQATLMQDVAVLRRLSEKLRGTHPKI